MSGTTSDNGSHSHVYNDIYYSECCPSQGWLGSNGSDYDNGPKGFDRATAASGSHTHTFDTTSASTGSGQPINTMPPFYALAYIMRVQ